MPRKTYIAAIQEALKEEMQSDESVILFGEDVRLGVLPEHAACTANSATRA